ncbi:AMP-binding protein [Iamia majanohamensis]|uniref:AMP-binding protein n=1 Tax=Iamia majanohamensis TaxID=467976 RepID=A0AAE9YB27_9ACTN|nr:AMP-binding protein [Iamia majanohamensis]WCO67848.1 AMP-binding protein [Iamia majanohamensis]
MSFPGTFAETTPDKAAVVMAGSGDQLTYAELDERATRLANVLGSLGLAPGDHVAFCIENQLRFLEVAWGCHYAGLYYTAASTRLTPAELSYIIDDCGAKAFIASHALADLAAGTVSATPEVAARLMLDGTVEGFDSYEAALEAASAERGEGWEEGVDMLYSSGTTGRPKGVQVPRRAEPLGTKPALSMVAEGLFSYTADMRYLNPAPLYHAAPLRFTMGVHRVGGTAYVMEHFDPTEALRLIQEHRITHSQWVPTMFIRMLKLPDEERTSYDVSSMEVMFHAAAPCPVEVKKRMIDWFGPVVHEYYAGTEGNGFVYCNSEGWLAHPGTVGQNLLGSLHITDDDGNELPPGEPGTIWFEGGAEFEYHNDPEKTAGSRHPKGWSTLGDVGRLDEDGFLYLTDRKAYMIITGGVNVYPQEAENALALHPKVDDVAVFGVPNEDFGEEVKAVVQPIDMDDAGDDLERELIAYCRERLADVKCPRSVDFRPELPRHPTGKLYKRLLKDEYWEAAGRAI